MTTLTSAPLNTLSPIDRLHGITPDHVSTVISTFTAADWCQLEAEHLDHIGLDVFTGMAALGVDLDEDPIAVFCRLYLAARAANYFPRCQDEHPGYHADETVLR